jgi:hypothetical protein
MGLIEDPDTDEPAILDATDPGGPAWTLAYWMPGSPGVDGPGCTWEPIPAGERRLSGGCIFDLDATPPSLRRFALLESQRS